MPQVYIKSRDGWVDCVIVQENAKTYVVRFRSVDKVEKKLKVKDGKEIIKFEDVEKVSEIKVKKYKVKEN